MNGIISSISCVDWFELYTSLIIQSILSHHNFSSNAGAKIDEKFVAGALGVKPGQIITKEHVLRLTKEQIRKVAVPAQGLFSSNSYDYEFYKISPRDIAKLVAVLVKRDGNLKRKSFVEW